MGQASPAGQHADATGIFDTVHARVLHYFPDLAGELGGDARCLLRQVGIDPESLPERGFGATYRQLVQLLELAATELRCSDFGMRLAKRQGGEGIFGPLGQVMKNSKTFGDALEYSTKHIYAHSLAARIWQRRHPGDKTVFSGHDILLDRLPNRSQAIEHLLLVGHLTARQITGGHVGVRKVHFRHQPVSSARVYRRFFGCEVCFGQNDDGVVFTERDLACPIVDPDAREYLAATAYIELEFTRQMPPLHAQARGVIMHFLGTDRCTNDHVAAELNLHPRTLHRRLRAEGTSFQQVKDEVRRDAMLYYLHQTNFDFAIVSERLGFAEQSVMTRYCNRWLAGSPTKLRSQRERDTQAVRSA